MKKLLLLAFILLIVSCSSEEQRGEGSNTSETKQEATEATSNKLKGDLTFTIDTEKSRVYWTGKKMIGKHEGYVLIKEGTLYFTDGKISGGNFIIDLNTITNTDQEGEDKMKLEKHLKSEDFFWVDKYPEATLVIKSAESSDGVNYNITADLTIRGKTNPINFPAKVKVSDNSLEATAEFSINRQLWGVSYKGMADNIIQDEVDFKVELYGTPQQEAQPVAQ